MKYSFALAAIVAIAAAQEMATDTYYTGYIEEPVIYDMTNPMYDYETYNETVTIPEPEPPLAEKLFELNEEGQFQLVWPKHPAVSFTDADDAAVMEWWAGKNAEATALDQEFIDAYKNYESVVSAPYNDFLT